MSEVKINVVKNNTEKYLTYKGLNELMTESLKNNVYSEVILLTYPMIEDRLVSFMYYMNIVDRPKKDGKLFYTKYAYRIPVFKEYKKLTKIGVKIEVLELLIKKHSYDDDLFYECYSKIEEKIGIKTFEQFLNDLKHWKDIRNEIVHASFNKELNDLNEKKKFAAIEGARLAKLISGYVNKIKSNQSSLSIRDKFAEKEFNR